MIYLETASDSNLVLAIARWHEPAMAEIYRRHGGAVYPLTKRVLLVEEKNAFLVRGVSLVASAAAVLAIFLGLQVNHLNSQVTKSQAMANKPLYTQAVQAALEQPSTQEDFSDAVGKERIWNACRNCCAYEFGPRLHNRSETL